MEIGTFQRKGDGTQEDPFMPDFESGPAGPLGYIPVRWETISLTSTEITVRYIAQS